MQSQIRSNSRKETRSNSPGKNNSLGKNSKQTQPKQKIGKLAEKYTPASVD